MSKIVQYYREESIFAQNDSLGVIFNCPSGAKIHQIRSPWLQIRLTSAGIFFSPFYFGYDISRPFVWKQIAFQSDQIGL